MKGQRIGYIRVSTFDQNPERQLEHSKVDKVFTDKASGKDTKRPAPETQRAFYVLAAQRANRSHENVKTI